MIFSILIMESMLFEIFIAEIIFCSSLKRKEFYFIRIIIIGILCLCVTFWIELFYLVFTGDYFNYFSSNNIFDSIFKFLFYLLIFFLTIVSISFSYEGSIWTILLYCSSAYVTQHICKNIFSIVCLLSPLKETDITILAFSVKIGICAIIYTLIYFVFVKNKVLQQTSKENIKGKVILSLSVIFICIGLSRISTDDSTRRAMAVFAESLYAIVSCCLVLGILYGLSENDKMHIEMNFMKELVHREREQYKLSKENIEIINIKCHDLKHQINSLRKNYSESNVKEIEKAVMIYDSVIKTGNDTLDIILTEKSLLCEKNGITLTCVANGNDISFMDDMDIYSLFGNAVSNAMEAVTKINEKDKRCISINIKSYNGFVSIHIENFYSNIIDFENGLPQTDKNKEYHGFGLKSMKAIAKKYNGTMEISVKDNKFFLDFIFLSNKNE